MLKKLRGGILVIIGYMLSPLSWWNDLFFNLPIAYLFGYSVSLINSDLFLPFTIIGYWISNVLGILMMQFGVTEVFTQPEKTRNWRQDLLIGFISSTAYTVVIVGLIQFNWIEVPTVLLSSLK